MTLDIDSVLSRCPLFSQLDEESRTHLVDMAQLRRYPKGHLIFNQEDDPPGMFIVVIGQVRIFKLGPNGKEHVLHIALPGQTFLEVAVLGGFRCPADAETVTDTTCILLPRAAFQEELERNHALCLQLLRGMSGWVRQLVGLLEDIVLRDAMGRVSQYLLDVRTRQGTRMELPALRKDLASHLNLTSETLSRTLRRLCDARLIEQGEGHELEMLDPEGLEAIASGTLPRI